MLLAAADGLGDDSGVCRIGIVVVSGMNDSWGAIVVGSAVEKSTRLTTAIARTLLGSYADCIVGNQNRCVSGCLKRINAEVEDKDQEISAC